MKDSFSSYHPLVNLVFFAEVLGFAMFLLHPVGLVISLLCAAGYDIYLNGRKAVGFCLKGILPMMLIFSVLYLVLFLPVSYRLRFSTFCLVDAPRAGAMHAMHTSRVLLRRNCWKLFRLDLHFWWYHGLLAVASLIQMLPLMGFVLPVGSDATYYLCNGVYLAIVFGLYAAFRNRIECTYAAAYDALREKPKANSVVLGNIFDM